MQTAEQQVDRAVEISRDADIDRLNGDHVLAFEIVDRPDGFIYDRDSWHSDCADMITTLDADDSEEIRSGLSSALFWLYAMQYHTNRSPEYNIKRSKALQEAALRIGLQVINNAIANGVTIKNIGE